MEFIVCNSNIGIKTIKNAENVTYFRTMKHFVLFF